MPEATDHGAMRLRLLMPTEIVIDEPVSKVIAEAENGWFCLLPRHADFVAALVPGVLMLHLHRGPERFAAMDRAVLVKCARDVLISTPTAVVGAELSALRALVDERFVELDEHERRARTALARLEAGTLRGFREMQERFHDRA